MIDCCKITKKTKKCSRKSDKKIFSLPRRFTKKRCIEGPIKGFTMRSSCAPFKDCIIQKGGNKFIKNTISAVCVLHNNNNNITGTINFTQEEDKVKVSYNINGLKDGKHGFHVHEYGDLTDGSSLIYIINEIISNNPHFEVLEIYNLGAQSHVQISFENPEYTSLVDGV